MILEDEYRNQMARLERLIGSQLNEPEKQQIVQKAAETVFDAVFAAYRLELRVQAMNLVKDNPEIKLDEAMQQLFAKRERIQLSATNRRVDG